MKNLQFPIDTIRYHLSPKRPGFLPRAKDSCYRVLMTTSEVRPLAFRMRPVKVEDLLGQDEARAMLEDFARGDMRSVILWGPPGTGKTSVASIIEHMYPDAFRTIHAVTSGVQEIRSVTSLGRSGNIRPIAFIDEIHRFTRVQQDALLPFVESG
ncbi:MAG TPA: AAA family ATPase, partial [Deltaproteobacteria bacterium]|nr:AAA family ATPase [Deltaproteobacteria bacterium]